MVIQHHLDARGCARRNPSSTGRATSRLPPPRSLIQTTSSPERQIVVAAQHNTENFAAGRNTAMPRRPM